MADAKAERGSALDRNAGWPLWVKVALLLGIVLAAVVGNVLYDRFARRTIIVEVDTGTLRVTLERELSGKSFQNALVCRQREQPDVTLRGSPFGCISRTHVLTPSEAAGQDEAGGDAPAPGRETFDLALPAGTRILLYSDSDRISLVVEEIPGGYAGTDVARLEGGGITLAGPAARSFGSLVVAGRAVIGASPNQSDRISVVGGSYQIRGGLGPRVCSRRSDRSSEAAGLDPAPTSTSETGENVWRMAGVASGTTCGSSQGAGPTWRRGSSPPRSERRLPKPD